MKRGMIIAIVLAIVVILGAGIFLYIKYSPKTEYYCQWSWPQKIINKNTSEVLWICPLQTPYCKATTTNCCKYNNITKTHYDCIDMS